MPKKLNSSPTKQLPRQNCSLSISRTASDRRGKDKNGALREQSGASLSPMHAAQKGGDFRASQHPGTGRETELKSTFLMIGKIQSPHPGISQKHLPKGGVIVGEVHFPTLGRIFVKPMAAGLTAASDAQTSLSSHERFRKFWDENLRLFCNEQMRPFSSPQMRTGERPHARRFWSASMRRISSVRHPLERITELCIAHPKRLLRTVGKRAFRWLDRGVRSGFFCALSIVSAGEIDLLGDERTRNEGLKRRICVRIHA